MATPKSLLDVREGRTQTNILAAIAEAQFHDDVSPRQRDLVDRLPISKGAVSNNCSKLVGTELVTQEDKQYYIDETALLSLYREHVDSYLVRESRSEHFQSEVENYNETRTALKRELRDVFIDNDLILSIVSEALVHAKDDTRRQTLRDVFHHTDQIIQHTVAHIVTSNEFEGRDDEHWSQVRPLLMIAASLTHLHDEMDAITEAQPFLNRYFPGTPPETTAMSTTNK